MPAPSVFSCLQQPGWALGLAPQDSICLSLPFPRASFQLQESLVLCLCSALDGLCRSQGAAPTGSAPCCLLPLSDASQNPPCSRLSFGRISSWCSSALTPGPPLELKLSTAALCCGMGRFGVGSSGMLLAG